MKPLLTFNFKSTKPTTAQGCQILPNRLSPVNVDTYKGPSHLNHLLIHSGYSCIPWKPSAINFGSQTRLMLSSYIKLLNKTNAEQILIHMPKNQEQYDNFKIGLALLYKVNKIINEQRQTNQIPYVCVEIVYNTMYAHQTKDEIIKSINALFVIVVRSGLDIVIDTAHCYANGLNVDDMIALLKRFQGHYKYIHLNGNYQDSFKPDKHTLIMTEGDGKVVDIEPNKINDCDKLLRFISTLKDVVLVCEIIYDNYDYWHNLANKYDFDIITEDEFKNGVV